jgi:hypothetical protein
MRGQTRAKRLTAAVVAMLLGACTARMPADVELVSVQAVERQGQAALAVPAAATERAPQRLLRVDFASRVNLVRFVAVNGYSLGVETGFCDGANTAEPLAVSGILWQGRPLVPGGPDPIRREGAAGDGLLAYSFFLDAVRAASRPADLCFSIAGGNAARGYRSNTVTIPRADIAIALVK